MPEPTETGLWNRAITAALEAMEEYDSRATDRYELMGHCLRAARPFLRQADRLAVGGTPPQQDDATPYEQTIRDRWQEKVGKVPDAMLYASDTAALATARNDIKWLLQRIAALRVGGGEAPIVPGAEPPSDLKQLGEALDDLLVTENLTEKDLWEAAQQLLPAIADCIAGRGAYGPRGFVDAGGAEPSEDARAERIAKQMWEEEIGDPPWEIISAETRLSKTQRVQKVLALRDAVRGAPPKEGT